MFKMFVTLLRGQAAAASEEMADRHALAILDQQMRDATSAFERAKRALAIALAQDQQEGARLTATRTRIADLEGRVTAALQAGDDPLAREGAEALAALEADRDAAAEAQKLFASQIGRLRAHVAQAQSRITDLDRGRRIARASEAVRVMRRGGIEGTEPHESSLAEAERTLRRLRERQTEAEAADSALEGLDGSQAATIVDKLAAKGFGPRLKPSADEVLARLRAGIAQPT